MLLGKQYLRPAIAMLQSFAHFSGLTKSVGLSIHADASLTPRDLSWLQERLPTARLVEHQPRDERIAAIYANRPHCRRLAETYVPSPKLFQIPAMARAPRVIVLDPDMIFYRAPQRILDWVTSGDETPLYLREGEIFVPVPPGIEEKMTELLSILAQSGSTVTIRHADFNSGTLLFPVSIMNYDLIERYLAWQSAQGPLPGSWFSAWCREQTAYMLLYGAQPRAEALDGQYVCGTAPAEVLSHFLSPNYFQTSSLRRIQAVLQQIPTTPAS